MKEQHCSPREKRLQEKKQKKILTEKTQVKNIPRK